EPDSFKGHQLLDGGSFVVSIPDDKILLKHIRIPKNALIDEIINFELIQMHLDTPDKFIYDAIETAVESQYLGMILRKTTFDDSVAFFENQNVNSRNTISAKMRSQALVEGFLTYCRHNGGELGAIIDLSTNNGSIGFYYKKKIIDLSHFSLLRYDFSDDQSFARLSVELKTLLNFKKESFQELGISIPLSGLYLVGDSIDENKIEALQNMLKVNVKRPEINKGYFSHRDETAGITIDKYLIALGLTVYNS
ncbi:MAG: hypothetical protein DWP97_04835, partial [Calditrichaeota bacterium]